MNNQGGFSEFEVKDTSIRFLDSETEAKRAGCVGKLESTMDTKTISKKCEGIEVKSITKGTGTGTGKISLHMNYKIYLESFGMLSDGLIKGVYGYGNKSRHKPFCLSAHVFDEDDNEKYIAYPNAVITSGHARTIENGAEEVAEIELDLKFMPDDEGFGCYEALASELENDSVKESWLTNFSSDLVKKTVPQG